MTIDRSKLKAKLKASLIATFITTTGVQGAFAQTPIQDTEGHKIETTNSNSRDEVKLNTEDLHHILMSINLFKDFMDSQPQRATEVAKEFLENVLKVSKVYDKNTVGITAKNLEDALLGTGFNHEDIQPAMQFFYEKQGVPTLGFDAFRSQAKQDFEDFRNEAKQSFNSANAQTNEKEDTMNGSIEPQSTRQTPTAGEDFVFGAFSYNGKMCDYQINKDGEVSFSQMPKVNISHLIPKITENAQGNYDFGNVKDAFFMDKGQAYGTVESMVLRVYMEHEVYRHIQSIGGAHSAYEQAFVNNHKIDMEVLGLKETKDNYLKQTNPHLASATNYQQLSKNIR